MRKPPKRLQLALEIQQPSADTTPFDFRIFLPEEWKPSDTSSIHLRVFSMTLFDRRLPNGSNAQHYLLSDNKSISFFKRVEVISIVNTCIRYSSEQIGNTDFKVTSHVGPLSLMDVTSIAIRGGVTPEEHLNDVYALSRLEASCRSILGSNILLDKIVDGFLTPKGLQADVAEIGRPNRYAGREITPEQIDLIQEIENRDSTNPRALRGLELLRESQSILSVSIRLITAWQVLELFSGGKDVKPRVRRLFNWQQSDTYKFGLLHLEQLRNLIVHSGVELHIAPRLRESTLRTLDLLCIDVIRDLLCLDCKGLMPSFVSNNNLDFRALNSLISHHDPNWHKKVRSHTS